MKKLLLVCLVMLGCGGSTSGEDAGQDSTAPDGGGPDSAKIDSGKDGSDGAIDDGSSNDAVSDAGNDGGSMGDGGFDVGNVSGLVLWLDAAKGVTKNNQNQVSAWADQSSAKNNAAQSTGSLQPVCNASVINGLPAMRFDKGNTIGRMLIVTDAASLQWGTGDFLVEVVSRFDNSPSFAGDGIAAFYFKTGSNAGVVLVGNAVDTNMMSVAAGITGATGPQDILPFKGSYNDSAARGYAFHRTGQTLELRVNGAQVGTKAQSSNIDVSVSGNDVFIGSNQNGGNLRMNGDIAEIIAVKGSVSAQDLSSIEAYLKAKYNL